MMLLVLCLVLLDSTGYLGRNYMKSGGPQIQKISIPTINQRREVNIGLEQSWCFKESSHSLKRYLLSRQSLLDGYQQIPRQMKCCLLLIPPFLMNFMCRFTFFRERCKCINYRQIIAPVKVWVVQPQEWLDPG